MLPPIKAILDPKAALRARMRAERKAITEGTGAEILPQHAAANFVTKIDIPENACVALYYPIDSELDTEPLLDLLQERQIDIALPRVIRRNAPLEFKTFRAGDPMSKDKKGILAPTDNAETVQPTIILTPLLAFTAKGERLGYGGGYYDRTLEELRAKRPVLAVGYAFAKQEVDSLPRDQHDQRLDWVVTEREAVKV